MSKPIIAWGKLVPFAEDQQRSFEELCYQIATTLHEAQGRFTSVDDSGGGDGVEFYITFPNGEQWGWQAKFYFPDVRLSASNRKTHIKESLQRACDQHPNLKKWFLCTPTNLTTEEQKWFDEELPASETHGRAVIAEGRAVKLDTWNESDFVGWMSEERFAGIKLNFFGELELTRNWFRNQVEKQMAGVRDKFDPLLHTKTDIDERVHQILADQQHIEALTKSLERLRAASDSHRSAVATLGLPRQQIPDWQKACEPLFQAARVLEQAIGGVSIAIGLVQTQLDQADWKSASDHDWLTLLNEIQTAVRSYRGVLDRIEVDDLLSVYRNTGVADDDLRRAKRTTQAVLDAPAESAEGFWYLARSVAAALAWVKESDLHILGRAGYGKTHLCCQFSYERMRASLPVLLILGTHFTTDQPIEQQLRSILDIPPSYGWKDFLGALDSVGRACRTRIPIIIDGLNEATVGGSFSGVWKRGIAGFCRELSNFKSVVLVTTCRNSYQEAIWDNGGKVNHAFADGFPAESVRAAVDKYFRAYKIKADLTAAPLEQFRHPIYLKIYCEVENPERAEDRHVYIGEQSLLGTFDAYLEHCNRAVCQYLGLHLGTPLVKGSLNKLAEEFWERRARSVKLADAVRLIDGKPLDELDWPRSKTHALESEGLLLCRDWADNGEELSFTYDLLGGYLIARSLLEKHESNLEEFLGSDKTRQSLYSDEYARRHPLHEDVRRSLAALLPVQSKRYLHDLVDHEGAFADSVEALFEIAPQYIDDSCKALIADLFRDASNRRQLLELSASTFVHPGHPLNASFWHEQLMALAMPERDESWTEYLRSTADVLENVREFEDWSRSTIVIGGRNKERLDLLAIRTAWMLTSTFRPLRDAATKALYWYGRRFPEPFFDLVMRSLEINDPYVSERALAAAYGIAMARQHDFRDAVFERDHLPRWATQLFDRLFKPNAPNSTTHILSRDYARRVIEIALLRLPDLLQEEDKRRIRPPYLDGGIRNWGESEDRNDGQYRNGDYPLGMDFENYTLGHLVEGRNNYDYAHPGFQRVRANILWRIYHLGYSLERFSAIDQSIAASLARHREPGKAERYGEKYSWIAYFELAGFLCDQGSLAERLGRYGDERVSDADIDPSFPERPLDYQLVRENYLGSTGSVTREWIERGGVPDISPFLVLDALMDMEGPWVLLDGYINQEDQELDRGRFTFIRSLLLKEAQADRITLNLTLQNMGGRWLPEIPENHYLYAGEIPWCDLFVANDWDRLEFSKPRVSDKEEWQVASDSQSDSGTPRRGRDLAELISLFTPTGTEEQPDPVNLQSSEEPRTHGNQDEALSGMEGKLAAELSLQVSSIASHVSETSDESEPELEALVPLREYGWESYHSVVNDAGRATVLARQLADALNLVGQPQTFDLFDAAGRRATLKWRHNEGPNAEHFVFIRRDLLDRLLEEQNLRLVWVTWGERQHSVKNMANRSTFPGGGPPWCVFQEIRCYPECIVHPNSRESVR